MSAKYLNNYAILQSGFWKIEVDTLHPRITSLRSDPAGRAEYCQEILTEGLGGLSVSETKYGINTSRNSAGHTASASLKNEMVLAMQNIQVGDFALVDLHFSLTGAKGEILRIEVHRTVTRRTELVTDVPFGLHCVREFSLWSKPDLRLNHNPANGCRTEYSSYEERSKRRVVGYHSSAELPGFYAHGSPAYPDLLFKLNTGLYHIEQHYCSHVLIGISSHDFSSGPACLEPGENSWILDISVVPQGSLSPVSFASKNPLINRFVKEFFDGYLLSSVSADHEFFGNNPYRHCFAPCAMHFETQGFMITDRRCWSEYQGDIEERWRKQIMRTLDQGRINPERIVTLFDSGVWQDACGHIKNDTGSPTQHGTFVLGCCWQLLKSGDKEFAGRIFSDLDNILKSLTRLQSNDYDNLLVSPLPGTPFGTPGAAASGYNDCLSVGHLDTYLNLTAYIAFQKFGSLLEFLDKKELAAEYRRRSAQIEKSVNKYLWNEASGRYAGWIDVNGKIHDFWFTDTNFLAIFSGIVPSERVGRIMASFLAHPNHHRIFAAGVNLDPVTDGTYAGTTEFGVWLNGGVFLGPASYELYARAAGLGGKAAWIMLRDLTAQWEKDRLSATPIYIDWTCPQPHLFSKRHWLTGKNAYTWIDGKEATGAGTEPYLSDGGSILWTLYCGVFGLHPDFQGITFKPHIPQQLADTEIGIRLMGKKIDIHYHGHGEKIAELKVAGKSIKSDRILWQDFPDNLTIDIDFPA